MGLHELVERLGRIEGLDAAAKPAGKAVARAVAPRPLKDVLSGSWLGHPFPSPAHRPTHRCLDQRVGPGSGRWAPEPGSGGSPDRARRARRRAHGGDRRVGLVRPSRRGAADRLPPRHGQHCRPRLLRRFLPGSTPRIAGQGARPEPGWRGPGHRRRLSRWPPRLRPRVNVNRNAWDHALEEWTSVADEADLRDGEPLVAQAGETPVLLLRHDGRVHAIADRCGHAGGPLHEGTFEDGCVICPWHQSV
jgi:hypothetical protein